jgi:hypothetical protein
MSALGGSFKPIPPFRRGSAPSFLSGGVSNRWGGYHEIPTNPSSDAAGALLTPTGAGFHSSSLFPFRGLSSLILTITTKFHAIALGILGFIIGKI